MTMEKMETGERKRFEQNDCWHQQVWKDGGTTIELMKKYWLGVDKRNEDTGR